MSNEQVTFISSRMPGLQAGTYTVKLDQRATIQGVSDETYSVVRHFQVRGERFSVRADEIHSVFPPEKSTGPYIGCVPHVLFNRAMLPWLRSPCETAPPSSTWLAVLLFDADEAPTVTPLTVRDLVDPNRSIRLPASGKPIPAGNGSLKSGYLSYPFDPPWDKDTCELEYGESADDGVVVVDLLTSTFKALVPSVDDMEWLAHVREVDLKKGRSASAVRGGKSLDEEPDLGQFATVLGNRVPAAGNSCAMLVSLEGLGDYLPGGKLYSKVDDYSYVRLVVLKQWKFSTLSVNETVLRHALDHLCDNPDSDGLISHLRIPTDIPAQADVADALTAEAAGSLSETQAETLALHAFAMGYVPLAHQLRTGGRDISWYRGPLTPLPVTAPLKLPLESVDSGFAYNPETGLFDVSYAAAWQLGQILGMADQQFSTTLYAWQKAVTEQAAANKDQLSIALSHLQAFVAAKADSEGEGAANLLGRILATRLAGPRGLGIGRASEAGPPDEVKSWLKDLTHFKRVPLRYLVPDGRMLRSEALRFFYLDTNWINAMLDGACSIARSVAGGQISENPWFYPDSSLGKITGCLIKSEVVLSWPGLRISALNGQTELNSTYDDQIIPGIRMMLFDGELDTLVIQEKGEELHFGVDFDGTTYTVGLRQLGDSAGLPLTNGQEDKQKLLVKRIVHYDHTNAGWARRGELDEYPPSITANVAMRDANRRVIDVANTAKNIQNGLIAHGALSSKGLFTSAEYALEVVKSTVHVSYQLDK